MMRTFISILILLCTLKISNAQYIRDHISIGIGPSMLYGDNAGEYTAFKFKILPSATLAYNNQIADIMDLRATFGVQMLNSGGYDPLNTGRVVRWGDNDQAFDFKGNAYFGDIMSVVNFNPNIPGRAGEIANFYAGLGLGVMYVNRDQEVLKNGRIENEILLEGEIIKSKQSTTLAYLPFRVGVSTNLESDWDYSFDFSLFTALDSGLDGNNMKTKRIKPDMMGQFQIVIKRYFGRSW
ncbi:MULTISPECIES: hypothetical protein [Rhodonellum]|nr:MULTISPECIES: hypothetical protein [Rhodonellum]SDZ29246.1 hypothetical protein SAMN05444412_109126 [Rhodonellum ikkaensis]